MSSQAAAPASPLPGGRYAVTQFKGPPSAIAETWTCVTHEWLPATGEFSCEICIPVRPL